MKKYILFMVVLIGLSSCSSSKNLEKEVITNVSWAILNENSLKWELLEENENITKTKSPSGFKKTPPKR